MIKKTVVSALILLVLSVPTAQAQLFPGLNIPGLRAAGEPVPAPQTRAPAATTTTVLGATIGGVLGSKSNRTTEGTAIGGEDDDADGVALHHRPPRFHVQVEEASGVLQRLFGEQLRGTPLLGVIGA